MKTVAVVLDTTKVSRADAERIVAALEIQLKRDFLPNWRPDLYDDYQVRLVAAGDVHLPSEWPLFIRSTSDVAGAAGYHDLESSGPAGQVFVDSCVGVVSGRDSVASDLSHELLELLVDPDVDAYVPLDAQGNLLAYESCDPVQENTYTIDGVEVSDFVCPKYFDPLSPNPKFDFLDVLTSSLSVAPGGYQSCIGKDGSPYQTGAKIPERRLSSGRAIRRHRAP